MLFSYMFINMCIFDVLMINWLIMAVCILSFMVYYELNLNENGFNVSHIVFFGFIWIIIVYYKQKIFTSLYIEKWNDS